MNQRRPDNLEQYKRWMETERRIALWSELEIYERHYARVVSTVKESIEESSFWRTLKGEMKEWNSRYQLQTRYSLTTAPTIDLLTKPFESFLLKTFRKNVLENRNWPEAPHDGWVLPLNWFTRIQDIVRTLIVVRYLDGVPFLVEQLRAHCDTCGLDPEPHFEGREDGYYAAHVYAKGCRVEIPSLRFDSEETFVCIEIQITTQLQEVIKELLHRHYESKREERPRRGDKWKWDYSTAEFTAAYLGHALHFIDSLIVETREKQRRTVDEERMETSVRPVLGGD